MMSYEFIIIGWLIDGSGGLAKEKKFLHINNGRIEQIRNAGKTDFTRTKTLDLSSSTVLPCLVDSHVHLTLSGTTERNVRTRLLSAGYDKAKTVIRDHLRNHQDHGVLAVRDGGDKNAHVLRYCRECHGTNEPDVVVKTSGKAWHQKGRYGGLIGQAPADNEKLSNAFGSATEGIDQVKIVNSGLNSLTEFGKETSPQFSFGEMKEVVLKARMLGRKVMVHANGKVPVSIAIDAGCDSIEHGFFMGKENLKKMAEKQIIWVPTICTMKAFSEQSDGPGMLSRVAKRNLEHQLDQVSLARQLGVPVAVGTDAGSPGVHHGCSVSEEIKLLVEAGFTIEEAVKCATSTGAELLEVKEIGLLTSGASATFIVVKGDPSNLPDSLMYIEHLFIEGKKVDHLLKGRLTTKERS